MDDRELETLLNDLECDRVERKASMSDRSKIRQAICAFANDLPDHQQPGVLFIGVNDNGSCANITITDELLKNLSEMREQILPFPVLVVEKKVISGCELAVIIVEPSDSPPVRYNGRTWIRVGPRRATATIEEERRLSEKRRAKDLPFDLRSLSSATLDDLDLTIFEREYLPTALSPEVLEENNRTLKQQLTSLRFITPPEPTQPTNLGILVTGKSPRMFIPGAYIQFLRIDGIDLGDPIINQKAIDGYLDRMLRLLDETLQINISVTSDLTSQPIEIKQPDYPIVALQELTRNAVLHRNYETSYAPVRITWFNDRIEIQNPGGLFGQVTRENFQTGVTDYRNPHLAEAMNNLGYVQRFGSGIVRAKKELEKNGNPPPEFTLEDTYILVTLRRYS
ncbi:MULTISPECIES: ATP-binding protein [Spirulina sp. CCY15215]|uniref:ATP-binding protein n=1 Tax=Spirulina sp. CCY15215 TaxID=2767591 RepID=UPI00194F690F|nr:ATP-binding protein [Spirulina major]